MAVILFYAKPGCVNNNRQQALLREAGHQVVVRDLLNEAWAPVELGRFFNGMPVSEWFNRNAPRVKSGEVQPGDLEPQEALALMIADPLLIRRPLMEVNGETMVGFDFARVDAWIGLARPAVRDLESCPREYAAESDGCKETGVEA
jgi:nitrogenase-associated protein